MTMDCPNVRELMSAYYDDELPAETAELVARHLERCSRCAAELRAFGELSRLAEDLDCPTAPDRWPALHRQLGTTMAPRPLAVLQQRWVRHSSAVAAGLLMVGLVLWMVLPREHSDDHLSEIFDQFLTRFVESPEAAEHVLADAYGGRAVSLVEARALLRYQPAISRGVPSGYMLSSAYVIKMPCCTCFQTNLHRENGGGITLLEHDSEQTEWFGDRPAITAASQAGVTRLVQLDGVLAATCQCNGHHLTVVGARDLAEVDLLVGFWAQQVTN